MGRVSRMKNLVPLGAIVALALALTSCAAPTSSESSSEAATTSATSSSFAASSSGEPSSPAAATSSTAPSSSEADAEGSAVEGTAAEVEQALEGNKHVTGVKSDEPGRVEIATDLTDPRTDNSAEAAKAMEVCEAAAKVEGVTYVNVTESDGTSWILFGHPAYSKDKCTEV